MDVLGIHKSNGSKYRGGKTMKKRIIWANAYKDNETKVLTYINLTKELEENGEYYLPPLSAPYHWQIWTEVKEIEEES